MKKEKEYSRVNDDSDLRLACISFVKQNQEQQEELVVFLIRVPTPPPAPGKGSSLKLTDWFKARLLQGNSKTFVILPEIKTSVRQGSTSARGATGSELLPFRRLVALTM